MHWLLLDEITNIEKGTAAQSVSRVPQEPVSRELLLMEMMAQTGGVLLGLESDFGGDVIFAKIDFARFSKNMEPGEPIKIKATSQDLRPEGGWLDGMIQGKDGTIAESRFMLMNVGHLKPGHSGSITFHKQFMEHFKVREKVRPQGGLA